MNAIQNQVLQTTTIDPGDSYGGIALAETLSSSDFPQSLALGANWNGEDHVFRFVVSTDKSPAPERTTLEPAAEAPAPVVAAQFPVPIVSVSLQRKETLPEGYASHPEATDASGDKSPAVSFDQWEKTERGGKSNSSARRAIVIEGGVTQN